MRTSLLGLCLLITSSACASSAAPSSPAVSSWQALDPVVFNNKISLARESGQAWVRQPQLYAFKLLSVEDIRSFSYEFHYDQAEQPQNIAITLVRDGFLDDAQRGDVHRISLRRKPDRAWEVSEVKKAYSCWRTPTLEYSTRPCP